MLRKLWNRVVAPLPYLALRVAVWIVIHVLYRVRAQGLENVPDEGAAIVVCNHVSFVDVLIIGGLVRRPIRFVMYHKIFNIPLMNIVFRAGRAIPIAPAKEDSALLSKAYADIEQALRDGELVGIFPEGGLTPDGEIQPFKNGVEKMLAQVPVPVVPMALRNLWGSMWSRRDGRLRRARLPRRFRAELQLLAGPTLPAEQATAEILHKAVSELRGPNP